MKLVRCPNCGFVCKRNGKTNAGSQRWYCNQCSCSFTNKVNKTNNNLQIFLDEQISEYVLQRIIRREKDRQGLVMAEALGVSFDVGVSIFLFLVHGLYAVNKEYKWSQSDEWLEAQKIIFELVYRGLQRR